MTPPAPLVQKKTSGMPSSRATSRVKLMIPSDTMQETGGTPGLLLSLVTSSLKGAKQFLLVESQREGTSWVASASEKGSPSGMVSNWKDGRPSSAFFPLDFNNLL